MLTHRERRSRQAVAVTAMALAMGFLSVADAYAQTRRGNGFSAQSQTRRPFTVPPKAPRVPGGGGFQRINPPKAPRVTPKFVAPKAPRVQPGRQELVASKTPRAEALAQQTVPLPVKRSAKPKVVKKAVKHTTVRKKRPHRKDGYRGYRRSYSYRPYHGGYGGGYAHCR